MQPVVYVLGCHAKWSVLHNWDSVKVIYQEQPRAERGGDSVDNWEGFTTMLPS